MFPHIGIDPKAIVFKKLSEPPDKIIYMINVGSTDRMVENYGN